MVATYSALLSLGASVWFVLSIATVETWRCNFADSVEDDWLPLLI